MSKNTYFHKFFIHFCGGNPWALKHGINIAVFCPKCKELLLPDKAEIYQYQYKTFYIFFKYIFIDNQRLFIISQMLRTVRNILLKYLRYYSMVFLCNFQSIILPVFSFFKI